VPSVVAASGDAEGFGMVFIEAQAMGLPVVSTLSGGIPEAVINGETGLLVTERDPQALTEAILQLMEDEDLWQRYSLAGRKHVVNHFNLAQQTRRLESVFDQLLADPQQAGAGTRWGM
jgi:glycosyltransferase involved in cell wall biosynthesis